jgi:hypothetical protein
MSSGRNVTLVFLIMWVMCMSGSFKSGVEAGLKNKRVFVSIRNGLTTLLTLGCQSSEDDIGTRPLQTNQTYDFNFRPNIWGSTKFVCDFLWDFENKTVIHNNFLIYKYRRDRFLCGTDCLWGINQTYATQYAPKNGTNFHGDQFYPWIIKAT